MLKQNFVAIFIIMIFVSLFTFIERFSPSFQRCVSSDTAATAQTNQPSNKAAAFQDDEIKGGVAIKFATCSADFFNSNGSGLSALATIVIAAFTITLWRSTSLSARLAQEAMIIGKRAYVVTREMNQYWEVNGKTGQYHWRFRPIWENTGDTFARKVRLYVDCELRNSPLPVGFDFTRVTSRSGSGIIAPKTPLQGGLAPGAPVPAVSPQDLVDVQQGRKHLYLWGWISYRDVFPKTPMRITRFCWALHPAGDPFAFDPAKKAGEPGSLRFDSIHYPDGNAADEDAIPQTIFE